MCLCVFVYLCICVSDVCSFVNLGVEWRREGGVSMFVCVVCE